MDGKTKMSQLAVIVTSKEVRSGAEGRTVITKHGDQFWLCNQKEGWVSATGSTYYGEKSLPKDLKLFDSEEEIKHFLSTWKGHPFWCKPFGTHRTVRIKIVEKLVFDRYEIDN